MRSPNVAGHGYLLMVLTPIRTGLEDELRAYLDGLSATTSPLARVPRTHMARWLILPDMPTPPGTAVSDPMGDQYLLFTSNFDGPLETYLDELAEHLVPDAGEIWGRCLGCPQPAEGAALRAYIGRNQIDAGVVFAAYGDAPVQRVLGALSKRERFVAFAIAAQEMDSAQRRTAFLDAFGSA